MSKHVSKNKQTAFELPGLASLSSCNLLCFPFSPNDFHGHFESIRQILAKDHYFLKGIQKHAKHLQTSFLPQQEIFLTGRQHVFCFFQIYTYLPAALQKQFHPIVFFCKNCGGSTPPNNKKHLITVLYRHLSDVFCLLNKCRVTVVGCGKKTPRNMDLLGGPFFFNGFGMFCDWELFKIFGAKGEWVVPVGLAVFFSRWCKHRKGAMNAAGSMKKVPSE